MTRVFLHIFNLSITASWLIAAVLLVRWIIKGKTPRWVSCLLWAFVGLRLVIPFYFESEFSIIPSKETVIPEAVYGEASTAIDEPEEEIGQQNGEQNGQQNGEQLGTEKPDFGGEVSASPLPEVSVGENITADGNQPEKIEVAPSKKEPTEYIHSGFQALDERVNEAINDAESEETAEEVGVVRRVTEVASVVWLCGVVLMLVYAVVNYLLLKNRVSVFVPEKGNVRRSENVGSPFILGFVRPKIYLPFGLSKETEEHIIAHEIAHLNRRDHWIKPLGFALLSVYWFNPLVWVAYILLCRDIEYACDEKVVKEMGEDARKAYATALLECGVKRNIIAACPVAFGEIGVKDRVKSALSYKKPMLWIIIAAVVISAVTAGVFLLAPKDEEDASSAEESSETVSEEVSEESEEESVDESSAAIDNSEDETSNDETSGEDPNENQTPITGNLEHKKYVFETNFKDDEFNDSNSPCYVINSKEEFETLYIDYLFQPSQELKVFANDLSEDYFETKSWVVVFIKAPTPPKEYTIDRLYRNGNHVDFDVSYQLQNNTIDAEEHVIVIAETQKTDLNGVSEVKSTVTRIQAFHPTVWNGTAANGFESGNGNQNSPYEIKTAEQLAYLAKTVNEGNDYAGKYIVLSEDIKLNDDTTSNEWTPIGSSKPFKGNFDGQFKMIYGFYINSEQSQQGLFGYLVGATIKNVAVEGTVNCGGFSGGIVGNAISSRIENCSNMAVVSGSEAVGGIVGCMVRGDIINCDNYADISGVKKVGGIVGYHSGNEYSGFALKNCYNAWGKVTAEEDSCGGIAGLVSGVAVSECKNSESVTGKRFVGGIVGELDGAISDCYNIGAINGTIGVGGIAGKASGEIKHCFNTGNIVGTNVGGVVGGTFNVLEVKECYFLENGELKGIGCVIKSLSGSVSDYEYKSGEADPLTAEQMKKQESFVGFDFVNVWKMQSKTPMLQRVG